MWSASSLIAPSTFLSSAQLQWNKPMSGPSHAARWGFRYSPRSRTCWGTTWMWQRSLGELTHR
jgi:hypothetical protein